MLHPGGHGRGRRRRDHHRALRRGRHRGGGSGRRPRARRAGGGGSRGGGPRGARADRPDRDGPRHGDRAGARVTAAGDVLLLVVRLSDSFSDFWSVLARDVGVPLLEWAPAPGELPPSGAGVVLVAAGGHEAEIATLLITGETGTGKELLARALHYGGPRAAAPFVELNCAALPAPLLESELFGHERGAFTDAKTTKPGLFEVAQGGTLFLDEVDHLAPELQSKLLRALEQKSVRRLGATAARTVDVRIVAATNTDLAAAVQQGLFREDLYYRLNVVTLELPPLRARGQDVVLLAEFFLSRFSARYGLPQPPLTPEARRALLAHSWPGNIRELRNTLERAILLSPAGTFAVAELEPARVAPAAANPVPFPATLAEIQRAAARAMLAATR